MYLQHFGLREAPFGMSPDTAFFYPCSTMQEALDTLRVAVGAGEGFIKITGEVGTGKSLLCRKLMASLDARWLVAYLPNPDVQPLTLLQVLAERFEAPAAEQADQHVLLKLIHLALLRAARDQKRVLVCLDEAQVTPDDTLETLRLLTNLETEKRKLLQVVLFGQPELDQRLRADSLRPLLQRISFSQQLHCLRRAELTQYVDYRLGIAGYSGPPLFAPAAYRALHRVSRGTPRIVNVLANQALMLAYGEGVHRITARHISLAAKDTPAAQRGSRWPWWLLLISLFVALLWVLLQ